MLINYKYNTKNQTHYKLNKIQEIQRGDTEDWEKWKSLSKKAVLGSRPKKTLGRRRRQMLIINCNRICSLII